MTASVVVSHGKATTAIEKPRTLLLLPNDDKTGNAVKLLLWNRDADRMERVLELATEKLGERLQFGNARRIYKLQGKEVRTPGKLRDGVCYVVVDRDPVKMPPFIQGGSGELMPFKSKNKAPPPKVRNYPIMRGPVSSKVDHSLPSSVRFPPIKGAKRRIDAAGKGPQELHKEIIIHDNILHECIIDELTYEIIDEVLTDAHAAMYELLCGFREHASEFLSRNVQGFTDLNYTTEFDDMVDAILDYMLRPTTDVFAASATPDEQDLAARFIRAVEAACEGKLGHWEGHESSFVALVILLDQFPRTIWRGSVDMYHGDSLARDVVLRAVQETGIMQKVHPVHMLFPCLALSHQEDLQMQQLCLQLWDSVSDQFSADDPIWTFAASFKSNYEIIARFGRFPQRNSLFNRASTDEELAFLEQNENPSALKRKNSKTKNQSSVKMRLFKSFSGPSNQAQTVAS